MNYEQYERWKDFSFRMIDVAVSARKRSPSRAMVREQMEFFFECRMDADEEWRRVRDWDYSEEDEYGHIFPVCDHVSDMSEYWIPDYWSLPYEDEKPGVYDKARDRWCGPASCCIRAGLDVAVSPSAGVVGFTVGDLRKMYPEGVPDWVKEFFESDQFDAATDNQAVWL